MLSVEEVNALLEEAFYTEMRILEDTIGGPYKNSAKLSVKSYRRCKTTQEHGIFPCDGNLYRDGWETMRTKNLVCMCILDEPNHMILVMASGVMRMNPAVVELFFSEYQTEITAWAKEGLIKQHAARKAVAALCSALELTR